MTTVTLTGTSASLQTWTVPKDAPAGTVLTVECWGAGSGGSGRASTSNGMGGGGGAYCIGSHTVSGNDANSGIPYWLTTGSAGTSGAISTFGPNTIFGVNGFRNILLTGGTIGTIGSGGALPTNMTVSGSTGTLSLAVVGFGSVDPALGLPYVDLRVFGTTVGTQGVTILLDTAPASGALINNGISAQAVAYTTSGYFATIGTVTGSFTYDLDTDYFGVNGSTYINTAGGAVTMSVNALSTRSTSAYTPSAGTYMLQPWLRINAPAGTVDVTVRVGGLQVERGSVSTYSSIGAIVAKGGNPTTTAAGATGGQVSLCQGTSAFVGGAGATFTQGGGGGGAAGKDGAGGSSTTATGGTGDNGSGGAGGAPGTSNIEGGGGGNAVATTGGTGSAGGDPGGAGSGETGSSGTRTGGAGGRGQIRITYASSILTPQIDNLQQFIPMMAQ